MIKNTSEVRFIKYLTTVLQLPYNNGKVTTDLRRTSNSQNILRLSEDKLTINFWKSCHQQLNCLKIISNQIKTEELSFLLLFLCKIHKRNFNMSQVTKVSWFNIITRYFVNQTPVWLLLQSVSSTTQHTQTHTYMFPDNVLFFFDRSEHEWWWLSMTVAWFHRHNAHCTVVFPHTVGTDSMAVLTALIPCQWICNNIYKQCHCTHCKCAISRVFLS